MNIVKYYREEDHQIELNLILNDVNKHLRRIANGNVYGFEESKKKKAEDIISNWGTWTAPAKEKDRKKQNNKKMIQMENENVFEVPLDDQSLGLADGLKHDLKIVRLI